MTGSEIALAAIGVVLAAVSSVVTWMVNRVNTSHEDLILLKEQSKAQKEWNESMGKEHASLVKSQDDLRDKTKDTKTAVDKLSDDVQDLQESQVTVETVREVIENALDKRDKVAETRRLEWNAQLALIMTSKFHEELEKAIPRITREVKMAQGTSGHHRKPEDGRPS